MLMYGWMKWVELAPERYDPAVTLMTGGRLDKAKDMIANTVGAGERVLDVGCGTGTLALRCLRRGARLTGLDTSKKMLQVSRNRAEKAGFGSHLDLVHDSATGLAERFEPESFDAIMATLVLGELGNSYLPHILGECHRLLRPGGRLMIADEVLPDHPVARILYLGGLILFWIPQFLILRRAFFPIRGLRRAVEDAGFSITASRSWPFQSLELIIARKPGKEAE